MCLNRVIFQIVLWGNSFPFLLHCVSFLIWPAVEAEPKQNESCCYSPNVQLLPGCQNSQQLFQEKNLSTQFKRGNQQGFYCSVALTGWDTIYLLGFTSCSDVCLFWNQISLQKLTHLDAEKVKVHQERAAAKKT